jgi:zinc transporter, ZIP family
VPDGLVAVLLLAGAPALASIAGGWLSLHHQPSTLFTSIAYGFAGGAMLGTVTLEMLPRGLDAAGLGWAAGAFTGGFVAIYLFDLWMHGGRVAGEHAQQRRRVQVFQRQRQKVGSNAVVLAGATSLEEVVEGVAIGVAVAVDPALAVVVSLAVLINNLGEATAIGEMFRDEHNGDMRSARRPTLTWTGTIGVAMLVSAVVAWLLLQDLPQPALGVLVALGAGGLLYLTLSDLVPHAQRRHYQHSGALAGGAGFALIFVVAGLAGGAH